MWQEKEQTFWVKPFLLGLGFLYPCTYCIATQITGQIPFKPERWRRQHENKKFHHFAYLPLSAGGRNCIGQRFAMYEAKLIIAPIIREFEITLSPLQENVDFKLVSFITLKCIPSVKVRVKRRA